VDEERVVLGRLEPEQREPESVLPVRFAVAATGVASEAGEDRNDLVGEAHGKLLADPFHAQRQRGDGAAQPGGDDKLAIGQRFEKPVGIDPCMSFRADLPDDVTGHVVPLPGGMHA
jgi:hypothetical protein